MSKRAAWSWLHHRDQIASAGPVFWFWPLCCDSRCFTVARPLGCAAESGTEPPWLSSVKLVFSRELCGFGLAGIRKTFLPRKTLENSLSFGAPNISRVVVHPLAGPSVASQLCFYSWTLLQHCERHPQCLKETCRPELTTTNQSNNRLCQSQMWTPHTHINQWESQCWSEHWAQWCRDLTITWIHLTIDSITGPRYSTSHHHCPHLTQLSTTLSSIYVDTDK